MKKIILLLFASILFTVAGYSQTIAKKYDTQIACTADSVGHGANTYVTETATGTEDLTAYYTGMNLSCKFTNGNTGAATINVNGFGAKAITKNGPSALVGSEIANGQVINIRYDGTRFQIVSNNYTNPTQLSTDTISELTSGAGVLVDGTLIKDAGVLAGAGLVGTPAYSFAAQTNMGFYKVSSSQLGASVGGALVGGWGSSGLFTGNITEQVSGSGITFAKATINQYTNASFTTNDTLTAAQVAGGLLTITSGTDTLTMPTASALATKLGGVAGTSFNFEVLNIASGGTALLRVNTGGTFASTLTGGTTATIANSSTTGIASFRIRFLSATAYVISRM